MAGAVPISVVETLIVNGFLRAIIKRTNPGSPDASNTQPSSSGKGLAEWNSLADQLISQPSYKTLYSRKFISGALRVIEINAVLLAICITVDEGWRTEI
jgi:hypothetical protein